MKEQEKRLYRAITDIEDDLIEEAGADPQKRTIPKRRILAAAASFLLVVTGTVAALPHIKDAVRPQNAEVPVTEAEEQEAAPQQEPEQTAEAPQTGPIKAADLALPAAKPETDLFEQFADSEADIAYFEESLLSACCGVLEGTVLRIDGMHYEYDLSGGKAVHGFSDSAVYELSIEKVWWGEGFEEGTTILIEDPSFFPDAEYSLMEGRSYVIPVYEYGETLQIPEPEAAPDADVTRDSVYSTLYPFHPQITRTEDGAYLVTADWTTLAAEPCRPVESEEEGYYRDQLRLVGAEAFTERLEALIGTYLK